MSLIIEQIIRSTIDDIIQTENQIEINNIQTCFANNNFDNLSEFYIEKFKKNYFLYENLLIYEQAELHVVKNTPTKRLSNKRIKKLAKYRLKYKKNLNNSMISNAHKGLSKFAKEKLKNYSKTKAVAKYTDKGLTAIAGGTIAALRKGKQKINKTFRQRGVKSDNKIVGVIQKSIPDVLKLDSIDKMKSNQKNLAKEYINNNIKNPKTKKKSKIMDTRIGGKTYKAARQNLINLTNLEHKRKKAYGE